MTKFNESAINNFTIDEVIRYAEISGPFADRILDIFNNFVSEDDAEEREGIAREQGYEEAEEEAREDQQKIEDAIEAALEELKLVTECVETDADKDIILKGLNATKEILENA